MTIQEMGQSPGLGAAKRARAAIEEALFAIADVPSSFDREDLRDRLLRAIADIYVVMDTPVIALAHLDGLRQALARVEEARVVLDALGAPLTARPMDHLRAAEHVLREGARAVAEVQLTRRNELVRGAFDASPEPRPFRASVGTPSLHAPARAPLLPFVDVSPRAPPASPAPSHEPPPKRPATFEELAAFAARAWEPPRADDRAATAPEETPVYQPYEPAITEVEALRQIGADCLAQIAGLRHLRKPNALESWLDQAPFEERLLSHIDAFAALGGAALPLVSIHHAEAKNGDPDRAFATALVLGCIEGRDTIAAAVMTLKQSKREEHPGWVEGLSLASNPFIDEMMLDLAESPKPDLSALALDVLIARGEVPTATLTRLATRDEIEIKRRVARAFASATPRRGVIEELERLLDTPDDLTFLAAVESLLRLGHAPALDRLRDAASAPRAPVRRRGALALLCLAGDAADRAELLGALTSSPAPALARAIGRFGHKDALPILVDLLRHEDASIVAAAASSLDRMTGAGLSETVEEPWDVDLPHEAEGVGIPVPTRTVTRTSRDPNRWAAWLDQHRERLQGSIKYRSGKPFTIPQLLDELEAGATRPDDRSEAAIELAIVTGLSTRFSADDWVARQRSQLTALRPLVAGLKAPPGAWVFGVGAPADEPAAPPEAGLMTAPMPPLRVKPVLPFTPETPQGGQQ